MYILLCDSNSYYVGITNNLNRRVISHKKKKNIATKEFDSIELVYNEVFDTRKLAESREKQLKGWSKAKKKALIVGNKEQLVKLSKTRGLAK